MRSHHLQGVLKLCCAKFTKLLNSELNKISRLDFNNYVNLTRSRKFPNILWCVVFNQLQQCNTRGSTIYEYAVRRQSIKKPN